MTWTQEDTYTLLSLRGEGLTFAEIARRMGVTRSKVAGKLWRLGECNQIGTEYRARIERKRIDPWEDRLFEPWSARKARLANERRDRV